MPFMQQRVLEHCKVPTTQQKVMDEILGAVSMLAQDQYGNYVVQVYTFFLFRGFGLLVVMILEVYFYGSHDCLVYFSMLLPLAAGLIVHLYLREIVMTCDCSPKNCNFLGQASYLCLQCCDKYVL